VIVTTSGVLEYRHNRRKDVTNLTYQLEARSDLMTGTWSNVVFGGVHTTVKNSEYDTVIHPVPLVGTNSFIRLKITEQ